MRNDDESSSSDPERFAAVQDGIRKYCPGMIVQFSTGGRGRDRDQRSSALHLRPDMASLSTGSVNFPTIIYENHTRLVEKLALTMGEFGIRPEIEIFDLSHIHAARRLADKGLIDERPHVQFVLGIENALPAEERILDILLAETRRLAAGGDLVRGRDRTVSGARDGMGAVTHGRRGAYRNGGQYPCRRRIGSLPAMPNWSNVP